MKKPIFHILIILLLVPALMLSQPSPAHAGSIASAVASAVGNVIKTIGNVAQSVYQGAFGNCGLLDGVLNTGSNCNPTYITTNSCILTCNLPWGGTITGGSSVTAYNASSVTSPATCASVSQTRTCYDRLINNNTSFQSFLSGSYLLKTCTVAPSKLCPATIINNCSLPSTLSGSTSGSCNVGYSGACNYTCTNGTWNQNSSSNSCVVSPPTATLIASPYVVDKGQTTKITLTSTGAATCNAIQGNFSTGGATSGTFTTGKILADTLYQVECTGPGGINKRKSNEQQVTVRVPTVSLSADPTRVASGGLVTLSWNATNVNSCTLTKNGILWKTLKANLQRVVSGTATDPVTTQTIYKLTCVNNAGLSAAVSTKQIVNVSQTFQMF